MPVPLTLSSLSQGEGRMNYERGPMRWATLVAGVCLASLIASAQGVTRTMLRLPDTGETNSYTTTYGEDADYTINAPYFLLDGDGTVTDTITSLMWQQTDGGEMTIEDAIVYCDTSTLGGHLDWRLPTAHEAFSILDHQHSNPALDPTVFTTTAAEYWWTSTRQANDNTRVWVTNAGGGIGNHPQSETISAGGIKRFHVRAVRDVEVPLNFPSQFTDNGNGTATDALTGLMWQRSSFADTLTWEEALVHSETLTFAGADDWRLPNIKELRSINDETVIGPSLDAVTFSDGGARNYWSSTTLPNQTAKAWYMNTAFGITTYATKTFRHYVLCVRGGQDPSTGMQAIPPAEEHATAYPVPFQDRVTIAFDAGQGGSGVFAVHGPRGERVAEQRFSDLPPGMQRILWDAPELMDGIYFYRITLLDGGRTAAFSGPIVLQR